MGPRQRATPSASCAADGSGSRAPSGGACARAGRDMLRRLAAHFREPSTSIYPSPPPAPSTQRSSTTTSTLSLGASRTCVSSYCRIAKESDLAQDTQPISSSAPCHGAKKIRREQFISSDF